MTKNKKIIIGIIIVVLIFAVALTIWQKYHRPINTIEPPEGVEKFCGWSTYAKCKTDADCNMGGCSGEVCEGKGEGIITPCVWRDCYSVPGYKCKCVDSRCQWAR